MQDATRQAQSKQLMDQHQQIEEMARQESEARWQSLVNNAPNFITIVDKDGIVEFINHTVPGITVQDVIGKSVYDFLQPEYRDLAERKIRAVFESGEADYYVSAALGPDGTVAWYENYLGPIKRDAQVIAVTLIASDISERKATEDMIRSLARFPSENRSPVMRVAQDGTILYANEASVPLLAFWDRQLDQELPDTWRHIVVDVIKSGEDLTREIVCEDRIFSVHVTPVTQAGYANLYGHDITQLKEAEKIIRSLARFPSENRNPVMRVDQNGKILYANEASTPLLELWACQVGQELPDMWRHTVADAMHSGEIITREVTCEDRIFTINVTPVAEEGYANLYGSDITEQKQAEDLLTEQNRFINTVFESLAHPFYVIDAEDYTIKMANTAANAEDFPERITCYALTHFRDTPCDGAEHLCPLEEVKRTGKSAITEHIHVSRGGNRRNYEVHGHPIFDNEGNVSQVIEYTLDITERVRAEEALRKAHDELERRVEERTAQLLATNRALQAAVSQNTKLYRAEQRARHTAETLAAASLALTQTLDLSVVMDTLLEFLHQLVPYDSASFLLPQDETHLVVRATRGDEHWTDLQKGGELTIDTHANPHIAQLLAVQKSILIPDTRERPGWKHFAGHQQIRSWLGVPLVSEGKVIGLCALDKIAPGFFTQQHIQLAEALVGQATVAVQNSWLFEQVRAGRERQRALSHRLVEVQEIERRYIARELHDEAGQALTSLMVGLRLLEREAERPEAIVAGTAELKRMLDGVLENLHRLAADLRPASLDHLGLVAALRQYVEAVSDRHSLVVQFEAIGIDERLPADIEIALYRIVQEAVTNVIRHARATRVDVLLEQRSDKLIAFVEDNGVGFDSVDAMQGERLGLFGMRERSEMLGGTLVIESAEGSGTTLRLEVPYVNSDTHRR